MTRFWKLFSRRVLGDRGRPGQSSAPFWSPNPAARGGSESEDCGQALRAPTPTPPPDPRRFCGGREKPAPRPRESRSCSWGRDAGKGLPEGWRRHAARVEEWPGRFLHFSSLPSLTFILLLPQNLRSEGQKVAFAGRTVKWASWGRGVVRGFPSLNWAQNQALCPRF